MTRYGILSILPTIKAQSAGTFDRLYQMVGQNTGNLLFTNAVWNQIGGEKERINFTFVPDKLNSSLDALVIPAANWLSPTVDFTELANLVEKLTIPVVLIGLGAQDEVYSGEIAIPPGTQRFVRAVSERSRLISVRGAYTKEVLSRMGVENVEVTGCPSLYHDFRSFKPPKKANVKSGRGLFHSTRFTASYAPFARTDSIHRQLFQFAFEKRIDLLYQSEPEEMGLLLDCAEPPVLDARLKMLLGEIYGASEWNHLEDFIRSQGRVFLDVDDWSEAASTYDYVFGTRLHGTIMALNSGVPAFLIHHDSRTREMCEFAGIPSIAAAGLRLTPRRVRSLVEKADLERYYSKRSENKQKYRAFLQINDLEIAAF